MKTIALILCLIFMTAGLFLYYKYNEALKVIEVTQGQYELADSLNSLKNVIITKRGAVIETLQLEKAEFKRQLKKDRKQIGRLNNVINVLKFQTKTENKIVLNVIDTVVIEAKPVYHLYQKSQWIEAEGDFFTEDNRFEVDFTCFDGYITNSKVYTPKLFGTPHILTTIKSKNPNTKIIGATSFVKKQEKKWWQKDFIKIFVGIFAWEVITR